MVWQSLNLNKWNLSLRVLLSRYLLLCVFVGLWANLCEAQRADVPQPADTLTKRLNKKGSQILDDSTKMIYGPTTTRFIAEEDIFFNRKKYHTIDTSIHNYHRWTYVQRFNYAVQDLGNVGTALNFIFPQAPNIMGATSGFNVYAPYFDSELPVYFDTKSPYTRMRLVWGGLGRAMTEIEFSRNINPRWNFGFNYRPLLVDKQVQRQGKGDRQTVSHYYDVYTNFKSKNEKYQLILNYRRIRHLVNEQGGVSLVSADSTYSSFFSVDNRPILTTAASVDQRNHGHLFHQFIAGKGLQIYHASEVGKQINQFKDNVSGYYDNVVGVDSANLNVAADSTWFSWWTHEFGVKGNVSKVFYNGYVKTRSVKFRYKYIKEDTLALPFNNLELYFGGRLSFEYDSASHLLAAIELLDNGNYDVNAELTSPWIDARARRILANPSYLQNTYRGTFDYWNNNFSSTQTTKLEAHVKATIGPLFMSAGGNYTLLSNYIYFKQDSIPGEKQTVLPYQSSGQQQLLSPEVRMDFQFFRRFHLRPQVVYSRMLRNDDEVLQIPELFVNTQLTFEKYWKEKDFQIELGVDFHWNSAYRPLGYDPAIQQFYVQREVVTPSFPLTDIFLNAKMKRGRLFVKYFNLVQRITQSGYMPTPYYPGQRNIVDFGFELLLFD